MEKIFTKEEHEYMTKFASRFWAESILEDEHIKKKNLTQAEARIVAECWLMGMDDRNFHIHFLKAYITVFEDIISRTMKENMENLTKYRAD